jgi:hypothetical protein
MTDEQAKTDVTIGEEIRCLLDAGRTWDGDKLVHPTYKAAWRMYQRVDSGSIAARPGQLDAEIDQAVRKTRQKGRQNVQKDSDDGLQTTLR